MAISHSASPPRPDQAKILRGLAERLEQGAEELPDDLIELLIRALEDRADLEDVQDRKDEPTFAWEKVKAELGL